MNSRSSEKGQIVVIFIVALVVLLGLTALAIDGGMVYSNRRYAQTVADASSLAGAGTAANQMESGGLTFEKFWNPAYASVRNATLNNACDTSVSLVDANNIESVTCTELTDDVKHGTWTALSPHTYASFWDRYIEVHTRLTTETSTAFAHLFFKGPLTSTVDSVTHVKPRTKFAFGYAVASTSPVCGNKVGGIDFDGTADILVANGGVFSNSCINAGGNAEAYICMEFGPNDAMGDPTCAVDADVQCVGECGVHGGGKIEPAPVDLCPVGALPENCAPPMPQPDVLPLNCIAGEHISGNVYSPGTYDKIQLNGSDVALFKPGLYCITEEVKVTGGTMKSVNADGSTEPGAVTFYITSAATGPSVWETTGGLVKLVAPTKDNAVNGAKAGFLLYVDPTVDGAVKMVGNGTSLYSGIVYGQNALITIGGGSGDVFNGQVVGAWVNVTGEGTFSVNYTGFDPNDEAPVLDLIQ